jgi:hypothetical protein
VVRTLRASLRTFFLHELDSKLDAEARHLREQFRLDVKPMAPIARMKT